MRLLWREDCNVFFILVFLHYHADHTNNSWNSLFYYLAFWKQRLSILYSNNYLYFDSCSLDDGTLWILEMKGTFECNTLGINGLWRRVGWVKCIQRIIQKISSERWLRIVFSKRKVFHQSFTYIFNGDIYDCSSNRSPYCLNIFKNCFMGSLVRQRINLQKHGNNYSIHSYITCY